MIFFVCSFFREKVIIFVLAKIRFFAVSVLIYF